jgi:hypothetical protein
MLLELIARFAPDGFNWRENVDDKPSNVPVNVTFSVDFTAETVAVKVALAAFAGMVIDCGTSTAALLLERPRITPALGAGSLSAIVQETLAAPVTDDVLHVNELMIAELELVSTDLFTVNPAQPENHNEAHAISNPAARAGTRVLTGNCTEKKVEKGTGSFGRV